MRIQKWVILITFILILNTYYDGKIFEYFGKGKKYYTMIMYSFVGLSLYMFIKKHPGESKNMFLHANSLVKYMPIEMEHLIITFYGFYINTRKNVKYNTNGSILKYNTTI